MLKEAIDRIAELGVQSSGIEVKHLCNRTHLVRKGHAFETVEFDAPERCYIALDCDSFVKTVAKLGEDPLVMIDSGAALAVLDEENHKGKALLNLEPSRAMKALVAIGAPTDQKKLIAFLREELADCIEPRFLAIVRRLDFTRRNDGKSHVIHGRESLGKEVEAAVQSSEGELPEGVLVTLPAWTDIGFNSVIQLRCAVSVDPVSEKIWIRPMGEELEMNMCELRNKLRAFLFAKFEEEGDAPLVICGSDRT